MEDQATLPCPVCSRELFYLTKDGLVCAGCGAKIIFLDVIPENVVDFPVPDSPSSLPS